MSRSRYRNVADFVVHFPSYKKKNIDLNLLSITIKGDAYETAAIAVAILTPLLTGSLLPAYLQLMFTQPAA